MGKALEISGRHMQKEGTAFNEIYIACYVQELLHDGVSRTDAISKACKRFEKNSKTIEAALTKKNIHL